MQLSSRARAPQGRGFDSPRGRNIDSGSSLSFRCEDTAFIYSLTPRDDVASVERREGDALLMLRGRCWAYNGKWELDSGEFLCREVRANGGME